jgi:TonB family protein
MITAMVENPPWPRRRWALAVVVVMGFQLGVIFWLSRTTVETPRTIAPGPAVYLATGLAGQRAGVGDPTLFVLANRRGFSGKAWLQVPPLEYDLPKWSDDEVRPLGLPVAQLGSEAGEFLRTNMTAAFELATKPQPDFYSPPPPDELGNSNSALTIEGELAGRPLLSQFKLDSWATNEILTVSEVSAAVDAHGNVFSAVLLTSSGSKGADDSALRLAASARFRPLPPSVPGGLTPPPSRLQWGKFVFHWHTVPSTNAAPALP